MRPFPTLLALAVTLLAGCGDPVETPGLAGEWTGTTDEVYPHMEYYGTVDDGMDLMEGSLVIDEVTYPLNLTRAQ